MGWSIYWIYLAKDMDQWRVLLNTVMNFLVQEHFWKFFAS
jgi:hypothetical protein